MKKSSPTHEAIALRSYQLWEEAGRPDGHSEEFWALAEIELRSAAGDGGSQPPPLPVPQAPAHAVPPVIREAVQLVARPAANPRSQKGRSRKTGRP